MVKQATVSVTSEPIFQQGDKKPHIPALDGLRAIAIMLVLFSHGADDVGRTLYPFAAGGWCGVDLFFVLSGFLITKGLLKTKGAANYFSSFYIKRVLRIFPVFYLALVAIFLVLPHFAHGFPLPPEPDRKYYWLYLNNWANLLLVPNIHLVGHFWSLAVEEQFYMVWPAIVLLCNRKQLTIVAILSILGAPVLRGGLFLLHIPIETIYRNTFCRVDGLMAGALCALIVSHSDWLKRVRHYRQQILIGGAFLLLLAPGLFGYSYYSARMLTAGISLYVWGFSALVLVFVLPNSTNKLLSWKPLRYIGLWSYGIYVYHLSLYYFLHQTALVGRTRLLIEIVLSVLIAALSYQFLESKLLRYKDRFSPTYR